MEQPGAGFTRRIEDFDCAHCGRPVKGTGYTNHCPACLWSRHVDVNPGDRAAECGALMEPVAVAYESGRYRVVQRCQGCGHLWRNRTSPADSMIAIRALAGRPVPGDQPPPAPRPARRASANRGSGSSRRAKRGRR